MVISRFQQKLSRKSQKTAQAAKYSSKISINFNVLINSSITIWESALQSITLAPDIFEAGRSFHQFARDAVIVAHNAPFDMAFLCRHAARMGVEWTHPILDTVLLSAVLFGASETHTLDAVCERLDITISETLRHTALGDAVATAEVLVRMLSMLTARGMVTFGDVIAETRKHGRLLEDLN